MNSHIKGIPEGQSLQVVPTEYWQAEFGEATAVGGGSVHDGRDQGLIQGLNYTCTGTAGNRLRYTSSYNRCICGELCVF